MKAFKKTLILAGYLTLGVSLSCEIEDEYFYPDRSEQLGTKVFTGQYLPPIGLFWGETTNEVFIVNIDGITAIEAKSKKIRKLAYDPSNFTTQTAWMVGNSIYQLNTNGGLSKVDLTTFGYTGALVDSAFFPPYSSPFTTTHFAYVKFMQPEINSPSIFLYDLKSHKETYVGPGLAYVFSPDGNQLVFSNNGEFFVYDLKTKLATSLNFNENERTKVIRWTTDGILSFDYQFEAVFGRNESKGVNIGKWKSAGGFAGGIISPSGKHIITTEIVCVYKDQTIGNCANGGKRKHAITDIATDAEVPMAYTITSYIYLTAFSPDETTFAFATNDSNVYIIEPQN